MSQKNRNAKTCFYCAIKRFFDIIISFVAILFIPIIAFFIKLAFLVTKDFCPIFYTQIRIGQYGKPFKLIKFRTMVRNADKKALNKLLKDPKIRAEWEKNHKLKNDPRITHVGKILRKTSIDEIPQFINIFIGQMSLIGPRPLVKKEIIAYGHDQQKLLSVKPGLTGWWACNGRSNTSPKKRRELELYYVDHFSFTLDIRCFFMTIAKVLSHEGAE